ncbi:MAG: UpxY family transcription antiterminator [Haliscomenobacter sp.]
MSEPKEPVNQLHESELRWFAVYTRYKREKMVRKRLLSNDIEIYLPLQQVTRYYTRKLRRTELPLISCYIFVKITRKGYIPVLEDPDVLYFVRQKSDLIAVPEREINILKAVTGEGIPVEVLPSTGGPQVGDLVEITQGRLYGIQGTLVEQKNSRFVVVELERLGFALRMQVELDKIRKVQTQTVEK